MIEETLAKYFEGARRQGRQEGRKEGRREGKVETLRTVLLQQMTLRFGRLPRSVRSQVQQISSPQDLEKLARRFAKAKSLQEMGLG